MTGSAGEELSAFVSSRVWTHGEGPTALFGHATAWLRRERVLLPGVTTLTKLVQSAREMAQVKLFDAITKATDVADPRLPTLLRGLLIVEQGERASRLESLRAGPTRWSGPALNAALQRVAAVGRLVLAR